MDHVIDAVRKGILSYANDPADSDYQVGYLMGLAAVWEEIGGHDKDVDTLLSAYRVQASVRERAARLGLRIVVDDSHTH